MRCSRPLSPDQRWHAGRTAAGVLVVLACCLAAPAARADAGTPQVGGGPPDPIGFNRHVRPILSDNCFFCHGPDPKKRKAGLRLDDRDAAIADGAIVPGDPAASESIKRITARDENDVMPPPDSHKTLTAEQIDILRRWIAQGARYESHWAYVPVARPPLPAVKDRRWPQNPIDHFVLAGLEAQRLAPSPPAERRTLLRRLALDLTGLPPTPDEVKAFLADTRTRAVERQVARLLASPAFGERMAVPWLDVVRFADTVGYHGDQNQNVFPYRDYVVRAFNSNKPFDRFTIEQLAGDLLPRPTEEQLVATGFNRLNMVTREGGAQPKEYLAKYMGDRVRTVGTAWLGSTVGCAECHDHKYDPWSMKDFYTLGAFFADIREWGVYSDYKYTPNPDLKSFTNNHPFPPEIAVESSYLINRTKRLAAARARTLANLSARMSSDEAAAFRAWREESRRFLAQAPDGFVVAPPVEAADQERSSAEPLASDGDENEEPKGGSRVVLVRPRPGRIAALRLELLPHGDDDGSVSRDKGKATVVQIRAHLLRAKAGNGSSARERTALSFHDGEAAPRAVSYKNGREIVNLVDGWRPGEDHHDRPRVAIYELADPIEIAAGDILEVSVSGRVGTIRLSVSPFAALGSTGVPSRLLPAKRAGAPTPFAAFVKRALARDPARGSPGLQHIYALSSGRLPEVRATLHDLHRDFQETRGGKAFTLVTQAWRPRTTRVLPRGNWQDETGETVQPTPPHFLPGIPNPSGRRLTRLDLARWLVSRGNPLTARAFVNRLWKQFFGNGLSNVLNDLGAQGEPPSHPELLDWLAAEFMDSGWDVKHMVQLIVTSRAYQQASTVVPTLANDPQNRLLGRQSQRRLEAEFVRDNALFVAGILNLDLGGPSVFPYQPEGYFENLQFPRRDWIASVDDRQWRRGIYTHWQRTFLHPMLANFDAPSREECAADRPPSNTPQQALTLLNDPAFVEAARALAERLLTESRARTDSERLVRAFELAVARPPRPDESAALLHLLGAHRERFAARPEEARKLLAVGVRPRAALDPVDHAAWASVCRVVLNLYETITRL